MRSLMLLPVFVLASCAAQGPLGKGPVRYADLPYYKPGPDARYSQLIQPLGPGLRLTGQKTIDMGRGIGPLTFLEFERDDTTPPSRTVCAFALVGPGRFKLIVPPLCLFYGTFRHDAAHMHGELIIQDVDGDGDKEVLFFSGEGKQPCYLHGVYFYRHEQRYFVFSSMLEERIERHQVRIDHVASLMSRTGYSYSVGLVDLCVDLNEP